MRDSKQLSEAIEEAHKKAELWKLNDDGHSPGRKEAAVEKRLGIWLGELEHARKKIKVAEDLGMVFRMVKSSDKEEPWLGVHFKEGSDLWKSEVAVADLMFTESILKSFAQDRYNCCSDCDERKDCNTYKTARGILKDECEDGFTVMGTQTLVRSESSAFQKINVRRIAAFLEKQMRLLMENSFTASPDIEAMKDEVTRICTEILAGAKPVPLFEYAPSEQDEAEGKVSLRILDPVTREVRNVPWLHNYLGIPYTPPEQTMKEVIEYEVELQKMVDKTAFEEPPLGLLELMPHAPEECPYRGEYESTVLLDGQGCEWCGHDPRPTCSKCRQPMSARPEEAGGWWVCVNLDCKYYHAI